MESKVKHLFNILVKDYRKGHYKLSKKCREKEQLLEDGTVPVFDEDKPVVIKKMNKHDAYDASINYLLHSFARSKKDTRFRQIFCDSCLRIPKSRIRIKDITFEDIINFVSPETKRTDETKKKK